MKLKTLLLTIFVLMCSTYAVTADPAPPGFYRSGDGVFMGQGTGYGTPSDIMRDIGLNVFELTTLNMPGWHVSNGILDATVTGMWSGGWAYSDGMNIPDLLVVGVDNAWAAYCVRDWTWEACPAGTVDFVGNWDTDDLGGDRIDHLSLLQAVRPMSGVTCTVPEPNTFLLVMLALAVLYLTLRICFITRG